MIAEAVCSSGRYSYRIELHIYNGCSKHSHAHASFIGNDITWTCCLCDVESSQPLLTVLRASGPLEIYVRLDVDINVHFMVGDGKSKLPYTFDA